MGKNGQSKNYTFPYILTKCFGLLIFVASMLNREYVVQNKPVISNSPFFERKTRKRLFVAIVRG